MGKIQRGINCSQITIVPAGVMYMGTPLDVAQRKVQAYEAKIPTGQCEDSPRAWAAIKSYEGLLNSGEKHGHRPCLLNR